MKAFGTFLILLAAFAATGQAQLGRKWDARFGGTEAENFYKIFRMPDGGYAIGGISSSGHDGDKTSPQRGNGDYYVVRTDSLGNKLWDGGYGGTGTETMFAMCVTLDGGILLAGHSSSGANGDKSEPSRGGSDYWVVRLDADGNKLWDKRYGGTGPEVLADARPCADGGFILTGFSGSNAGGDKGEDNKSSENGWVVRIDSLGGILWEQTYQSAANLMLWAGTELADGGFLFGGTAWPDSTYDISEYGLGTMSPDIWLARTDAWGNILWDRRYGWDGADYLNYFLPLDSGGAVIAGRRNVGGQWLFAIDSAGDVLWEKSYTAGGKFTGLAAATDGGFLLSEYTGISRTGDKTEPNMGWTQTWVVRTDPVGNKVWDKTVFTPGDNGGYAIESSPGCYVVGTSCKGGIGGYRTQPNWDTANGSYDFWMVELCEGFVDTTLCPQQPCTGVDELAQGLARVFPNPTAGGITVELPYFTSGDVFSVHGILGQKLFEARLSGDRTVLNLRLAPGLYLYHVTGSDAFHTGRLVVE